MSTNDARAEKGPQDSQDAQDDALPPAWHAVDEPGERRLDHASGAAIIIEQAAPPTRHGTGRDLWRALFEDRDATRINITGKGSLSGVWAEVREFAREHPRAEVDVEDAAVEVFGA